MSIQIVTVTWSISVPVELPDGITLESLNELGAHGVEGAAAVRSAYVQLRESEGEITDLQVP